MTIILDQLVEARVTYSLLEFQRVRFVSKAELVEALPKHHGRRFRAPGKNKPKESGYYYENARRLALMAEQLQSEEQAQVIPVLFRDADGTQSSGRGEWQAKWASMLKGFAAGGSTVGVPMLPQPKSEAWLLCACREPKYQHCAQLENESGNDDAPRSLKQQLGVVLAGNTSATQLAEAILSGAIEPSRIDMPSFNYFKARLMQVLTEVQRG